MNASRQSIIRWSRWLPAAVAVVALAAAPLSGQAPKDGRWMPWLGCWLVSNAANGATPGQVCIHVTQPGDVAFMTLANGKMVSDRVVQADGQPHAYAEGGCRGTETATW